jgi:hypothetical protein
MDTMSAGWERQSPSEIRDAVENVIGTPGFSLGHTIFCRYLKAPNHEILQPVLWEEFGPGTLSLHFGKFCKAVAKELGDEQPAPYALTDLTIAPDNSRSRTLKSCVIEAMIC